MKKHDCDNIVCNHNNTKGLCCLYNPDNCKYRQLQKENAELKEQCSILADCNTCTSTCKTENIEMKKQLTKAIELLKWALHSDPEHDEDFEKKWSEAEQFLSEVEK